MEKEAHSLMSIGEAIFYQPYAPNHPDEQRRPFVLILCNEWMRDVARQFSGGKAWALDSTFKTNQFGMPLYGATVPNQHGMGMPMFFMLCSTGKGHEEAALSLTLTKVFEYIDRAGPSVRPAAIVIDKSVTELNAIKKAVEGDKACWKGGSQVSCVLLLCHFHAKKAWIETLLPQVPEEARDDVYKRMCSMMCATSEDAFDDQYLDFAERYKDYPRVVNYVRNGWAGDTCMWRSMWPTWGRAFPHGDMDTTNLIERLWHFLKYKVFKRKINRSVYGLVVALVGRAVDGKRLGGATLVEFYKRKQELCKSGKHSFALSVVGHA